MSVFLKLQKVRNELRKMDLKKSGKNSFSKYTYYELGDFLPAITKLCEEHKICSIVNFTDEIATLTIIDAEKEDSMVNFTSQVAEANLKGCHQIQNLGAVQTYLRRYLYMNAFEIVEHDMLDENTGNKATAPAQQEVTQQQIKALYTCANAAGKTNDDVKAWIKQKWNYTSTKELNKTEYDELYKVLAALGKNNNKGEKTCK